MQTLVLDTPGHFSLRTDPAPPGPGPGEALVRVRRVGVCGTDLHAYRGRQPFFTYPRILGHELGVEILAIGDNPHGLRAGDRCAVEPYLNCGQCIACRRGKPNCCTSLQVLGVHTDGGMREQIIVPAVKLHRSDTLSLEQLALVETLGIGAHAVERAGIEAGEWVLVIGAGPIGLAVLQFVQVAGGVPIVLDINENRLAFCRDRLGAAHTVKADTDAAAAISALTGGDGPTAVFDATGSAASMNAAVNYPASGGRLIFVGLVPADITFGDVEFHRRELTILSSRNATTADFRRIIALMEAGRIDTTPWITHRAPCAEVPACFQGWLDPAAGVIKALVEF